MVCHRPDAKEGGEMSNDPTAGLRRLAEQVDQFGEPSIITRPLAHAVFAALSVHEKGDDDPIADGFNPGFNAGRAAVFDAMARALEEK